MILEQALVASSPGARRHENKVIAWSKGVDSDAAAKICNWSPIPNDFAAGSISCMSIYPAANRLTAISRSVLTRSGNRSVVRTRIVLANPDQIACFGNNPFTLARVLESGGHLSPLEAETNELSQIDVPDAGTPDVRVDLPNFLEPVPAKINHALDIHGHCVLVGLEQPKAFLCGYLATLPSNNMHRTSMVIGLDIKDDNEQPKFHINVVDQTNSEMDQRFARLQIRTIHAV